MREIITTAFEVLGILLVAGAIFTALAQLDLAAGFGASGGFLLIVSGIVSRFGVSQ